MADLPSRQELFRRFRAGVIGTPGTRISALEVDRAGSDINLVAAGVALTGEQMVTRAARALQGCFESTAVKSQLDRIIFDRKRLPRKPAAKAVIQLSLQRPTFAAGGGTVEGGPAGSSPTPTRVVTNRGIVYILSQDAVFGPTDLGPIMVTAEAELAGTAQTVDAGQLWSFGDTPFDTTITITNADSAAGGADEETDDQYRARSAQFFESVQKGTLAAIEFGLISTPGIATATAIEVTNPNGSPAAAVQAFILDDLGRANATLAAVGLLSLVNYRAAGIPVFVVAGVPVFVPIRLLLSFDSSIVLDTVQAAAAVRAAIVAALNNQRPGQVLYRSTIIAAAQSVAGVLIDEDALVEPTGTLIPSSTAETFRTRSDLIDFT